MGYVKTIWVDDSTEVSANNMNNLEQGVLNASVSTPPGAVMQFAMAVPPSGWLICNGGLLNRIAYAPLFAAIGTTFGIGDGSTTFGTPDLRGQFVRGFDAGKGVDTGRVFGSTQADGIASHTHGFSSSYLDNANMTGGASNRLVACNGGGVTPAGIATGVTTSASPETRVKNIALLYCIKY